MTFQKQIDLTLLFFVYNAVGDIISTTELNDSEKNAEVQSGFKDG